MTIKLVTEDYKRLKELVFEELKKVKNHYIRALYRNIGEDKEIEFIEIDNNWVISFNDNERRIKLFKRPEIFTVEIMEPIFIMNYDGVYLRRVSINTGIHQYTE